MKNKTKYCELALKHLLVNRGRRGRGGGGATDRRVGVGEKSDFMTVFAGYQSTELVKTTILSVPQVT